MSWASASSSSARLVVDGAGARLRARAAERLLVGRLAHRGGHDRRPGDEQLRGAADDHREVRGDDARGAEPGHRPERRGHDRDAREVRDRQLEAGHERHVGEAHLLERLDAAAAAGAVDEPHERQPHVVGEPLGVDHLLPDRRVGGAAADGEVVALDDGAAALDPPWPTTMFAGGEAGQLAVVVVGADAGERARSRGSCPRRTGARCARGPSAAASRAGARRARRRPSRAPAPRGGPAPRARAPSSCGGSLAACGRTGRAGRRARPRSTCDRGAGPSWPRPSPAGARCAWRAPGTRSPAASRPTGRCSRSSAWTACSTSTARAASSAPRPGSRCSASCASCTATASRCRTSATSTRSRSRARWPPARTARASGSATSPPPSRAWSSCSPTGPSGRSRAATSCWPRASGSARSESWRPSPCAACPPSGSTPSTSRGRSRRCSPASTPTSTPTTTSSCSPSRTRRSR